MSFGIENKKKPQRRKKSSASKTFLAFGIEIIDSFVIFYRIYDFAMWMVFKIIEIVEHIRVRIMFFTEKE